ncbi:MAG TPA: hypothetical protein VF291_02190 [Burkholderiaceae bacterium]
MDAVPLPLRTLLYRYFFFAWLFRDATRGSLLERAAAWHHNRRQARWLATYLRRWLVAGVLLFALGCVVELAFGAALASAFFYVPSALSVPADAVIAVAWVGLKVLPAPA